MTRIRRKHAPEFKLKAVIEILKGEKTATQLAGELGVHRSKKSRQIYAKHREVRHVSRTVMLAIRVSGSHR